MSEDANVISSKPLTQTVVEQRMHCRRRVLLTGKIVFGQNLEFTVGCTVKNLSEQGALVRLPALTQPPSRGAIMIFRDGRVFHIAPVWQRGEEAGLNLSWGSNCTASDAKSEIRTLWNSMVA